MTVAKRKRLNGHVREGLSVLVTNRADQSAPKLGGDSVIPRRRRSVGCRSDVVGRLTLVHTTYRYENVRLGDRGSGACCRRGGCGGGFVGDAGCVCRHRRGG